MGMNTIKFMKLWNNMRWLVNISFKLMSGLKMYICSVYLLKNKTENKIQK